MKDPLVSVIVPNYNYARYLPERLDSILGQTFQDFEIIILDDCSTDNSKDVIERYRGNPKVSTIIYNGKNTGSPFLQWDKGLELARGKYAWIAEADDLAKPTFLEKTVKAIQSGENVVIACSLSFVINENGIITDEKGFDTADAAKQIEIFNGIDYIRDKMLDRNGVYNASMVLFSIDACKIVSRRYRSMRYCGDWLFWAELMRAGDIAVVREKLNLFRKHGNSVSDEGISNAGPLKESLIIQNTFIGQPPFANFDYRITTRYKCLHNKLFSARELREFGITPDLYPLYWIYKHWLRFLWLRQLYRKMVKKKIGPLRVISY